jgi:cell wall-associated NlpC family hydrolase
VSGANGPDAFDCWGLLSWVYKHHLNIDLHQHLERVAEDVARNALLGQSEATSGVWVKTQHPMNFAAVGLSKGGPVHHVGVYCANTRSILHALPGSGVVLHPVRSLKAVGFLKFEYYHHETRSIC